MPTADAITSLLAMMATELAWLAIAWHVVAAGAAIALVRGWRPSPRVACILLTAPIMSVAVASFAYGNLFNAISFAVLAVVLAVLGDGLTQPRVVRGPAWTAWLGVASIAFGLVYPHFVAGSWLRAFAAAPVGVVPCPTIAVVAGAVILAGGFGSRAIPAVLATWVAFYAWFGIGKLGVMLDVGLLVALLGLVAVLADMATNRHALRSSSR